jgi:replicative DNA helicase
MRLSLEQIQAGWESVGADTEVSASIAPHEYRHYVPLSDAAQSFVRWAQNPNERIYTGVEPIDAEMRGIAPGEMAMMIGYSHGGKTLVLLHMLMNNREKRVALFIPDEPKTLVLTKLTCMFHNVDARLLEQRVADNDREAIDLLRMTAEENFPNLAVFDQPLLPSDMERAYAEVSDVWGNKPELVVVDYLELVEAGEQVPDKAGYLKGFGRRHDVPLMVLHQTSRTSGADGRKLTISSGAYGGEQQATSIIGVRRKKYEIMSELQDIHESLSRKHNDRMLERYEQLQYDKRIHEYTLTLSLLKNKRPGGMLVDDIDFELDVHTGRLWELRSGELPDQYLRNVSWNENKS